jgi:hypothetical protein
VVRFCEPLFFAFEISISGRSPPAPVRSRGRLFAVSPIEASGDAASIPNAEIYQRTYCRCRRFYLPLVERKNIAAAGVFTCQWRNGGCRCCRCCHLPAGERRMSPLQVFSPASGGTENVAAAGVFTWLRRNTGCRRCRCFHLPAGERRMSPLQVLSSASGEMFSGGMAIQYSR